MMSVIPGQISKYNEVAPKDHIIATKQAYVRYISHELRTPMNIIQNGLQFCISKIPENTSKTIEKITRKTLIETDLASRVALETLNDLLLYDKLESGLVEIKKEVVGVLEFVSQCTKTFSVQLVIKTKIKIYHRIKMLLAPKIFAKLLIMIKLKLISPK